MDDERLDPAEKQIVKSIVSEQLSPMAVKELESDYIRARKSEAQRRRLSARARHSALAATPSPFNLKAIDIRQHENIFAASTQSTMSPSAVAPSAQDFRTPKSASTFANQGYNQEKSGSAWQPLTPGSLSFQPPLSPYYAHTNLPMSPAAHLFSPTRYCAPVETGGQAYNIASHISNAPVARNNIALRTNPHVFRSPSHACTAGNRLNVSTEQCISSSGSNSKTDGGADKDFDGSGKQQVAGLTALKIALSLQWLL